MIIAKRNMKIAVTAGHNVYVLKNKQYLYDPGAVNYPHIETDITKETVKELIPMLERQGHQVLDATPYNQRFRDNKAHHVERCKRVDEFNADLYIDVHVNAGGGEGVEVWVWGMNSPSVPYARAICDNISKDMDLKNRGVKAKPGFWSVSLTTKPALIVEGAFIDNKSDMDKLTPYKYALSIAKAFGEVGGNVVVDKPKSDINKLYRVQVGAYTVKANAEKMLNDLKLAGFNGFIKEEDIEIEVLPEMKEFDYYEKEGLKVIETNPENVYIATLPGKNLREFGIYGINGTWQNNTEAHLARSVWGLAVNNNKPIGPNSHINSPNGHKRGTIIYYEDGTIEVKRVNHVNEIDKPIKWAIGGGMLLPNYNPLGEVIPADIQRVTAHTGMGYKRDRVYLIVTSSNCSLAEFRDRVAKLDLDGAIFLDGGGSTQMNFKDNKGVHSTRKLSHGIFLKGVK